MAFVGGTEPDKQSFSSLPTSSLINLSEARSNYEKAIENPKERHAEVGILSSKGSLHSDRLGKDEEYGTHRVGSVTKTFTAFLALKLVKDGVLPNGLATKCNEVFESEVFNELFEDPEAARNMTLEQLLSHTAGLEYDDHSRDQKAPSKSLNERFLLEIKEGRKYKHTSKPGDRIGSYSNAGLGVAGWMMEVAYNKHHSSSLSFAQIMQKELFDGVFGLSVSSIEPGPTQDIIQSPAGDMKSSVSDLLKVASRLQEGEASLEFAFGANWQSIMLQPRDLLQHHGLGCEPNVSFIQHAGMNREMFGLEERDITALVVFPLKPGDPGLVAMCDSVALGPKPQEQRFIEALKKSAGISQEVVQKKPDEDLDFFCPTSEKIVLFHGTDYLVTDVDPFSKIPPESIICSRNGMKHSLVRETSFDQKEIRGYSDKNGKPWLVILREDGRRAIYSDYCLVTHSLEVENLAAMQPDAKLAQSLQGIYRNIENSDEHPTYTFTEHKGHFYMREGNDKDRFPCLFIPDKEGGKWVVSSPEGRKIQFRFPKDPDKEFLLITDGLNDVPQKPDKSRRLK